MDRLGATLTMRHLLYEEEVDEIQNLPPFFERRCSKCKNSRWSARPGLEARLRDALRREPMVTLLGPRQCGMTTLANHTIGSVRPSRISAIRSLEIALRRLGRPICYGDRVSSKRARASPHQASMTLTGHPTSRVQSLSLPR